MLLLRYSCSPTSAYHFSHQFFAQAILYYTDIWTFGFWDCPFIYQFNHYPFFLDQYLSCKLTPKIFLLHFCLILKSITRMTNAFLCYKFLPLEICPCPCWTVPLLQNEFCSIHFLNTFNSVHETHNTDGCSSSHCCRCTPPLQRSCLYPIYLFFLSHPCLWPKQVYSKYYPKDSFCVYHSEYPSSTFITQKLPASKTPQTRQLNINE